jgi:uncharacterized protein
MSFSDIVRWLLPKEDHFFDYLEKQATLAAKGAVALNEFGQAKESATTVRDSVQVLEHEGDKVVHELEEALAKTFVTPIDREDLQRLSMELDDILDLTNGAARACVLYGVTKATVPMTKMMAILVQCTEVVARIIPLIRKHAYEQILKEAREIQKLEKEGDLVYREAIAALFREREVMNDIEKAIDHCDHVASTLANLAVKLG